MIKLIPVLLILTLFTPGISSQTDNNYVQGDIIIMLKNNTNENNISRNFGFLNMTPKQLLVPDLNIWLYHYDYSLMQADQVLSQVRKDHSVAIAQFNHFVSQRSVPNDTQFGQQWSMNNTGQTGGTPDADIDAPEAWDKTTGGVTSMGDSIIVAIVDGGFYLTHPDIHFWKNYEEIPGNGIDDDGNGYVDDVNGWNAFTNSGTITTDLHGTHCSGIAAAIGNNNLGVTGVNWGAKIMAIQGSSGTESVVIAAYGYALKERKLYNQTNGLHGAFIVSTSSSFGVDYGQPANFPLWCAFYDSLGNAGMLSACATANLNINVDSLGDIPTACSSSYMVSVTNTTNTDAKNNGAAYGRNTIDLGAPGTNILSTTTPGNYQLLTGTSMATPHVAGAIALILSAAGPSFIQQYKTNPGASALFLKNMLMAGVDIKQSLLGITVSNGRLNVNNSVLLIQSITSTGNNQNIIPNRYNLYQNYPNPFNPTTIISFDLPKDGFVSLKVYNILGEEVASLIDGFTKAGVQQRVFKSENLSSGVYFYKLTSGNFTEMKKMVLVK